MSQYVTQPVYSTSNTALVSSLFTKSRDKFKAVSQSLDNEADVNAFKFNFGQDNNSAIIVVLIIIAVSFVIFKSVKS